MVQKVPKKFASKYCTGDTIKMILNLRGAKLQFLKNNKYLGTAYYKIKKHKNLSYSLAIYLKSVKDAVQLLRAKRLNECPQKGEIEKL